MPAPNRFILDNRRNFLRSLGGAWLGALALSAQELSVQGPGATFSSDVRVVQVLANVRDKKGKVVTALGQDDFIVNEDGRTQQIRYFSHETDLPLTLGLLVDTSLSQRRLLNDERSASFRFLDKVLRAGMDKTFVLHFDFEAELLQDLTDSRVALQRALDQLQTPPMPEGAAGRGSGGGRGGGSGGGNGGGFPGIGFPGGMGGRGRRGGGYPGGGGRGRGQAPGRPGSNGGTTMYDAIYLASDEIMRPQTGRKALILLTDGDDHGSRTFLNDAIESAQRSDCLVYSILFADDQGGRPANNGKRVLEQISRETGGSFFEVSKKLSIDAIYDRIQEELRSQYNIGYNSDAPPNATAYRTVKVAVRQPGMTVQTREGYYPAKPVAK